MVVVYSSLVIKQRASFQAGEKTWAVEARDVAAFVVSVAVDFEPRNVGSIADAGNVLFSKSLAVVAWLRQRFDDWGLR